MKKNLLLFIGACSMTAVAALSIPQYAHADDDAITQEESTLKPSAKDSAWQPVLEQKYNLTKDQIQSLQSKGLNYTQIAIVAALAKASGKTIDDVVKMRVDQKMGWGEIAKALGVPPKDIGQAVASAHHDINEARHEARAQAKADKKAERAQERADRAEGKSHGKH